ncbi:MULTISPECIES: MBL fold metallo-hydrolase [unclassified Streptococcus]|uniref:MBL fold metallo-hydrolase n=1 Tax=unclassified Streptococcus TaxID=2608887 RepID=UPI001072A96C|nr:MULTISPECIES: MBL fold metallo-hydrolase [unclassified Streptococcus]MBF0805841.1 MBL fold metallo-hydrolase [Streptococcus sp. 19428wA2_WM07]TFU28585.1 MBL fold metallo-hydrolase [Streptococcus sp. WM07]
MPIHQSFNALAGENTYYLESQTSVILVDPGSDLQQILMQLQRINKPLIAIFLTHTHYDHIFSLEEIRNRYQNPPVYVSPLEADWLQEPIKNLSGLERHQDLPTIICQPAEVTFETDKELVLQDFSFRVLATPGHSIGGISLVWDEEEAVLTGDCLFKETIGRWDLPTGNQEQLLNSIRQQLFPLPDHYLVFPGHGPSTSIGHEKNHNPFF